MTLWEITCGLCDELFFSVNCVHTNCFQVFTSNGPTVIMPTWFCSRAWFSHVGPFDEGGRVSACPVDSSSGLGWAVLGWAGPGWAAVPP